MTEQYTICIAVDNIYNMARVELNDRTILEGNYHDFHPGVASGLSEYGDFSGYVELSTKIYQSLVRSGIDFRSIKTIRTTYRYNQP